MSKEKYNEAITLLILHLDDIENTKYPRLSIRNAYAELAHAYHQLYR